MRIQTGIISAPKSEKIKCQDSLKSTTENWTWKAKQNLKAWKSCKYLKTRHSKELWTSRVWLQLQGEKGLHLQWKILITGKIYSLPLQELCKNISIMSLRFRKIKWIDFYFLLILWFPASSDLFLKQTKSRDYSQLRSNIFIDNLFTNFYLHKWIDCFSSLYEWFLFNSERLESSSRCNGMIHQWSTVQHYSIHNCQIQILNSCWTPFIHENVCRTVSL